MNWQDALLVISTVGVAVSLIGRIPILPAPKCELDHARLVSTGFKRDKKTSQLVVTSQSWWIEHADGWTERVDMPKGGPIRWRTNPPQGEGSK